jgi:hypothetical protein
MHTIEQPTQAEATKAQGDPKSLQPGVDWGGKLFFRCYTSRFVLRRFFEWHKLNGVLDSFVARLGVLNLKGRQI